MKLEDFNYNLPKEFIAQFPVSPRNNSRLMIINKTIQHKRFYNIVDYLEKDDVLVINETKVIPAKLTGKKITGSRAEIIIEEFKGKICRGHIKTRNPRIGTKLLFGKYNAEIIDENEGMFTIRFDKDIKSIMKSIGQLPTPPYVKKKLEKDSQYQTVYSKKKGSIAAPTAGLHFTKRLLTKIKKKGVKIAKITLHVDFGTFLPVRDINKNKLHKEYFEIDKKNVDIINKRKGRLFAVGTTSVRTLESANKNGKMTAKKGETELFIKPGYKFKIKIDGLITNFHLPKSTLLMLVSAFIGREKLFDAYNTAIKNKYRFFSFGDAMLIFK